MKTNNSKKKQSYYLIISIVLICLTYISIYVYFNAVSTTTFTSKVMSEEDDGRTFEVPSSYQGFGDEPEDWANLEVNPTYSFGVRFNNVAISQGSEIKDAYVNLYSIGLPDRHDHVNCIIYGDDVNNADDFYTKGCLDRCGRIYTKNSVQWDTKTPFSQWISTPNLKEIIQEIVDRPGWKSGNSIALLFTTQRTQDSAVFNNFALGNSAELHIEFKAFV